MRFPSMDNRKELFSAYGQIVLGCVIGAAAYPTFLVPNRIAPGGLTGIATILNHLFGLPIGTTSLVMNIPLFLIGYKAMGGIFAFRSFRDGRAFGRSSDPADLLLEWIPLRQPVYSDPMRGVLQGRDLHQCVWACKGSSSADAYDLWDPVSFCACGRLCHSRKKVRSRKPQGGKAF